MGSRDAWLALFTAVLGVDATACRKAGPHTSPAGSVEISAVASVPSVAPSVAETVPDAAAPDDAALATAPVDAGKRTATRREDAGVDLAALLANTPPDPGIQSICGAVSNVGNLNLHAACGASANPPGGTLGSLGTPSAAAVPRSDATVSSVSGSVPSDARVLAGMRPGMKACFNQILNQDPTTADGRVTLTVAIAANGEVDSVTPSATTLPPPDVACVSRRVRNVQFDAPGGAGRTLVIAVEQKKVH